MRAKPCSITQCPCGPVTLLVLVGQCGVQLGARVLNQLKELSRDGSRDQTSVTHRALNHGNYVTRDGCIRCIAIDTEPKALERALGVAISKKDGVQWRVKEKNRLDCNSLRINLRPENIITESSGRSNNWAHGYFFHRRRQAASTESSSAWSVPTHRIHSSYGSDDILRKALHAIHTELHRAQRECSCFDPSLTSHHVVVESLIVVHSVAGGTGSGLGSRLIEILSEYYIIREYKDEIKPRHDEGRDDSLLEGFVGQRYPAYRLISLAVIPCPGMCEVNVQYVNMALALSTNIQHCDMIFLIENTYTDFSQTFESLNDIIALFLIRHTDLFVLHKKWWRRDTCDCVIFLLTGQKGYRYFKSGTARLAQPTPLYTLLDGTPEVLTKLLREMFEDVVHKLDARAYLWQYLQYEGMTCDRIIHALHYLRSLCVLS